jgi:DNA-binding MurR/RpiR family transcriptional regulator
MSGAGVEQLAVPVGGVLGRIRAESPSLPEALRRVAEQILIDPADAALATIVDLAERSGTSTATVTRFCRFFGFRGYAGLRVALATETGRAAQARWDLDIGREIIPTDPLERVLGIVASADSRAIQETANQIDVGALEQVTSALAGARRVELFGIGSSGTSATELAFRLQRIGVVCWARSEVHTALTNAALLRPGDVAIGLSHSGRTREVIEVLAEAGSQGATTVAVTSFPRSSLADIADLVLTTAPHETTFRPEALAAVHSQLFVLDLIYVALAQRTYDQSSTAFEVTARAVTSHRLPDEPTDEPPAAGRRSGRRATATTTPTIAEDR